MKIAIDGYNIALGYGTGVATYGRNLVAAAVSLGHQAGVLYGTAAKHSKVAVLNEVALAEGDPVIQGGASLASKAMVAASAIRNLAGTRTAREVPLTGQVILPASLRLSGTRAWNIPNLYSASIGLFHVTGKFTRVEAVDVDVQHWTYPLPLHARRAVNVYTLHDLVPLRLPYTTADRKRAYYRLCAQICERADHVLTVSECSRRDIIDMFGIDETRVTNLYQASDIDSLIAGVSDDEIARYVESLLGVGMRGYFLFFGAIEPKKNVARLLEAYLSSASETPLIIVGAPGWGSEQDARLLKSLTKLDAGKRVIWLGYLPRSMLAMLIAGARATLFPSLYEGFGLPVLESMSLGTPVVTSNIASLPEVAGDAALLVDPYDVRALTRAIVALDNDEGLRSELTARGRVQAAQFSAETYRQRLSGFYSRLV